jgi:hypothetical protein
MHAAYTSSRNKVGLEYLRALDSVSLVPTALQPLPDETIASLAARYRFFHAIVTRARR